MACLWGHLFQLTSAGLAGWLGPRQAADKEEEKGEQQWSYNSQHSSHVGFLTDAISFLFPFIFRKRECLTTGRIWSKSKHGENQVV